MKAALLYGPRDVRVGEHPEPEAGAGELLLRITAVGLCGSDLHYYQEGAIGSTTVDRPSVLGHEFAAEVVDERAPEYGFEVGTQVAVDPAVPCGGCEWCLRGHPNLCPHVRFAGAPPVDGALSERVRAPARNLHPVPDAFDPTTAALLEPLGVAIHALDLARMRPMDTVAVVGLGPIGLLLAQVARTCGAAEIYALDPLAYRCEAALDLGADGAFADPDALLHRTAGRGADLVLEATDSPRGPEHAATVARIGGTVVLVGIPDGDRFSLTASSARRKGLTLKMSRRMGHVYPRAIDLVRRGRVRLEPLITHRFPLSATADAFALQAGRTDGVLKSVVLPDPPACVERNPTPVGSRGP